MSDEGRGAPATSADALEARVRELEAEVERLQRDLGARVAAAVDAAPMVLWAIDPTGVVTLSQGRGLAALGLKPGQLVGANVFDLYPSDEVEVPMRRALAGEKGSSRVELDGVVWENRYYPRGEEGVIGISLDVTEEERAQAALRASEQRWRSLVEGSPDFILIIDSEHNIDFVNKLDDGVSMKEVVGQSVHGFMVEEERADMRKAIDSALRGELVTPFITASAHGNGTQRYFENRLSRIETQDGEPKVLMLGTDITERRQNEREKEQLQARTLHMQKLESLGVLAGGIAHDFNNLLVGVLGNVDLARFAMPEDTPGIELLDGVVSAAEQAAELCQQMLAYAGKGQIELRAVDLSALVRQMAQLLEVSATRQVRLTRRLANELPPIHADPAQVNQVVMNLITNASDAVEQGGAVTVETGTVVCRAADLARFMFSEGLEPGEYVYLDVVDNGCGMNEGTRDKMFDPFFTTKEAGHGLGMAAVLGVVRGHGGTLRVASEEGEGTTIRVLFPIADSTRKSSAPPAAPAGTRWQTRGVVMVVDDDEAARAVASALMRECGFQTVEAGDGQAALELLGQQEHVAAVILDLTMPVMGGKEALLALRGIDADLPVVITSGYNADALDVGLDDNVRFLHKPYRAETLIVAVAELLGIDTA